MSDVDVELPGMEDVERVAPKPKPKYRCKISVEVVFEDYINYQTDGDPVEWLEYDENVEPQIDQIINYGATGDTGFPDYHNVEVSYDDGATWQHYAAS